MRSTVSITKKVLVILVILVCVITFVFYNRNSRYSIQNTTGNVIHRHFISGPLNSVQISSNITFKNFQNTASLDRVETDQKRNEQSNHNDKTHIVAEQSKQNGKIPSTVFEQSKQNGKIPSTVFERSKQNDRIPSIEQSDKTPVVPGVILQPLDDFMKYPCVPGIPYFPQSDWSSTGRCVRTFNDTNKENELDTKCVSLRTNKGTTPICTYDAVKDHYISKSLQTSGQWEGDAVNNVVEFLDSDSDLEFLDLGCNIGTYTLAAAHGGKKVVAVDAVIDNLELLHKSLSLGKLHENVILIWNAISDGYSKVALTTYQGNVGGTAIRNLTQDDIKSKAFITQTIKLDDLIPLFIGKRIVIKMDIETKEYSALMGGKAFFDVVDIRMIQMEINWHRTRESGPNIVEYLAARNFKPYINTRSHTPLNSSNIAKWPGDVYFLKS